MSEVGLEFSLIGKFRLRFLPVFKQALCPDSDPLK